MKGRVRIAGICDDTNRWGTEIRVGGDERAPSQDGGEGNGVGVHPLHQRLRLRLHGNKLVCEDANL
jgi:hypothetical protein